MNIMNAKKRKEINMIEAFRVLDVLFLENCWDPVVTALMTDTQCYNRLVKGIDKYFKTNKNLIYWNSKSYQEGIAENKEIIPMMQHYNFNKYKEENEQNL